MGFSFANIAAGFSQITTLNCVAMIAFGTFLGIVIGALPGLTATTGVAIFLPLTFYMEPVPALGFLAGIYCGGMYGGSITAILINTPGTPSGAATVLDGHPLAQKGEAYRALQIALYASVIGGIISCIALMFFAPILASAALKFSYAEYFALGVFGLSVVAGLSNGNIFKGLLSCVIGLFIGCIGMDPISGYPRLTFGSTSLLGGWLERAVTALVPNGQEEEAPVELDQRLLATPAAALEQSRALTAEMSRLGAQALREALAAWEDDTPQRVRTVKALEKKTDHYEDILGTYLIRLSERPISGEDSREAAKLLKLIGDFERVADHAVNLAQAAEELREKDLTFSREAMAEKQVLGAAVEEVLDRSIRAFLENDLALAATVEPLEQVVDQVKEEMRTRHILRLQRGECSVEAGFVWNDLLTDLERVSDHCSNIAGCVMEMAHNDLNVHSALRRLRHEDEAFQKMFEEFQREYSLE